MTGGEAERRLERMFAAHADRVYAFACHRVDSDTARDVVSETFLVAWRRLEEVPDSPLPWLLGTARKIIANELRGRGRRAALVDLISSGLAAPAAADEHASLRVEALAAMQELSELDREVLMISAWYDLTAMQAARVLGCSPAAYAVRLSRARKRLRALLDRPGNKPVLGAIRDRSQQ